MFPPFPTTVTAASTRRWITAVEIIAEAQGRDPKQAVVCMSIELLEEFDVYRTLETGRKLDWPTIRAFLEDRVMPTDLEDIAMKELLDLKLDDNIQKVNTQFLRHTTAVNTAPMQQAPIQLLPSAEVTEFLAEKYGEPTFSALPYENAASWLAGLEKQWSGRLDHLQRYWSLKAVMLIKGDASFYKKDLAQIPDWAEFKQEVLETFPCETVNAELEIRMVQQGYADSMNLNTAIRQLTKDYNKLGDDYDVPIAARVLSRRIPPENALRHNIKFLTISSGREVLKKMRCVVASETVEGRLPKWALARKHKH